MTIEAKMMERYRSFDSFHIDDLKTIREFWHGAKWFDCPFEAGHGAYANYVGGRLADLLYCPICDKHAWLFIGQGDKIKAELLKEETAFRKLLAKFENLPDSLTVEEAFKLKDEKGCPLELLEDRTDYPALLKMIESRKVRKMNAVYAV